MEYVVSGQLKVSERAKDKGVIDDNVIEFIDDRNIRHYPYEMRMVVYKDPTRYCVKSQVKYLEISRNISIYQAAE